MQLRRELLAKELLESLAVLRELANTLGELVSGHLVLSERPAELRLVVDVSNLWNGLARSSFRSYVNRCTTLR